jgi:hypothetical protein
MILSFTNRFVFIKTSKTAGTSIEYALTPFCGKNDIVTANSPSEEKDRVRLGVPGPQNHFAPWSDYRTGDFIRLLTRWRRKHRFHKHTDGRLVRDAMGQDQWRDFYTFCFERNPWDRAVSLYYWRKKLDPRPSFSEFLTDQVLEDLRARGSDLYTDAGKAIVDDVFRFEELTQSLETVKDRLGLHAPLALPRAKGDSRLDRRSYREIVSASERDRIGNCFQEMIDNLGYEF